MKSNYTTGRDSIHNFREFEARAGLKSLRLILDTRRHKKDLWMGETGGAFNSGLVP